MESSGRMLAHVFAGWRTGLPGPVIVLQAGTAVNYFGTGLILPFEIIYLHQARGFPTATAGLVLAAVMGTAAVENGERHAPGRCGRFHRLPSRVVSSCCGTIWWADRPGGR